MNLGFSVLLMAVSCGMLVVWLRKKRELPDFDDVARIDLGEE